MGGITTRPRLALPVTLDCGCEVVPERSPGELMDTGSTLVICPGHGIRHEVRVASVTYAYAATRLDPPDPEEPLEPHTYTVDVHLYGAEPYPCIVPGCGQPREAVVHGVG